MTPAFWEGRRVFRTGHTGFKGVWLALWLMSIGAKVHGYATQRQTENRKNSPLPEAASDHDHVFHAALPEAHSSSRWFLSRSVSIGCQKPSWK